MGPITQLGSMEPWAGGAGLVQEVSAGRPEGCGATRSQQDKESRVLFSQGPSPWPSGNPFTTGCVP